MTCVIGLLRLETVRESFEYEPMKTVYTSLRQILCIFCASVVLVGCSYFDTDEHAALQTEKMPVEEPIYEPQPISVSEAIANSTDGRVQVFDLDNASPLPASPSNAALDVQPSSAVPVASAQQVPLVYSADPSVQIFLFDDVVAPAVPPANVEVAAPVSQPAREEDYVMLADGDDRVVVYFSHDSAALSQQAISKISSVAGSFNNAAGRGLTVEGHASIKANYQDAAQRRVVNLKISMDRAFAVASALIQQGIPAEAIRVMAWGDAVPPRELNGKTQEEAARRVEISR